jgi:hypothetical protein
LETTNRAIRGPGPREAAIDAERTRAVLEQELGMIREAILMVAGGRSRRVVLAGLQGADEAFEAGRALAATQRVRLISLWTDDEGGRADIAVEAIEAADSAGAGDVVMAARPLTV